MNTKRTVGASADGGRREADGNHEWTRIHTNLRRGFTSTDFADLGAETPHSGVATGFLFPTLISSTAVEQESAERGVSCGSQGEQGSQCYEAASATGAEP
jgi:hypothetical protein